MTGKREICRCVTTKPHRKEYHDVKCSPRGPSDARLMFVGMAPGMDEAISGSYFVGASGKRLQKDALSAGIAFDECRIQNVAQFWPHSHKLSKLSKEQRDAGAEALWKDIRTNEPELIVPLGGDALEFLTGHASITKWRGSILKLRDDVPNLPPALVMPTLHSSAILRSWDYHTLFIHDLRKAAGILRGDDVRPIYRDLVTCNSSNYKEVCNAMYEAALEGRTMACDIEVFKGTVACVSFSVSRTVAVSIRGEDRELWSRILECDNPKIWHNAMYDLTFLEAREGVKTQGIQHDTQLMWHALYPSLACSKFVGKSLRVLVSLFTNDNYYKDTLNNWKKIADWDAFYDYNARDSAVTYEVFNVLSEKLDQDERLRRVYDFEMALVEPYKNASILGFKIDTRAKGAKASSTRKKLTTLDETLKGMAWEDFNPNSWQQILKHLRSIGADNKTTSKAALTRLLLNNEKDSEIYKFSELMLEYKKLQKAYGTYYKFDYDDDGRVRTNWTISGTETGRMSNSKSIIFKGGVNLMTIPRPARRFFVADDGYDLVYADLSQAEARLVAYLAGCEPLIEAFESGEDPYKMVASWMFDKPIEEIDYEERFLAKTCVLGLLYGMGVKTWRQNVNINKGYDYISAKRTRELHDLFFEKFPEIRRYHNWIEKQVRRRRELWTLFGRRRLFRPRDGYFSDHLFREGYDYIPQGTVPDIINTAVLTLQYMEPDVQLLAQIHDAWLGQVRGGGESSAIIEEIKNALTMPLEIYSIQGDRYDVTIPIEIEIGKNWGPYDEDENPLGLREWEEGAAVLAAA